MIMRGRFKYNRLTVIRYLTVEIGYLYPNTPPFSSIAVNQETGKEVISPVLAIQNRNFIFVPYVRQWS